MFFARHKNVTLALVLGIGCSLFIAAMSQRASAHPAPDAAPLKIGAVNLQWIILSTDEGKKETQALQQQFLPQTNELKTLEAEIIKMQKDLKDQASKLSEADRTTRVHAIETKEAKYNRHKEETLREVQEAEQRMYGRLSGKMIQVVQDYAKANGYTVVLDAGSPQSPILFANEQINISQQVVDAYNKSTSIPLPSPTATK